MSRDRALEFSPVNGPANRLKNAGTERRDWDKGTISDSSDIRMND